LDLRSAQHGTKFANVGNHAGKESDESAKNGANGLPIARAVFAKRG
jgi:hypothetical protein